MDVRKGGNLGLWEMRDGGYGRLGEGVIGIWETRKRKGYDREKVEEGIWMWKRRKREV